MKKDTPKKHAHKDKESASIKIAEPITVDRRSRTDRKDEGKAMRLAVPLASHAQWQAPANRRDPIDLLIESGADRVPGTAADPLWAHDAIAVRFLPGSCGHYGGRSRGIAVHRYSRASLRRLPFGQLRQLRYAGTAADLRDQRLR